MEDYSNSSKNIIIKKYNKIGELSKSLTDIRTQLDEIQEERDRLQSENLEKTKKIIELEGRIFTLEEIKRKNEKEINKLNDDVIK